VISSATPEDECDVPDSHCVTILAPTPQDAEVCRQILHEENVPAEFVSSMHELVKRIRQGAGVALVAQEFLSGESLEHLRLAMKSQPSWSDVPIVVLLNSRESSSEQIADWLSLGHVTLLERPLRIALFVSTLRSKIRDRKRQYAVRDLLRRAEEANRSKSAFLANMSHEIRTPMTAILGYADLMEGLIEDEEASGYLATIRRNGDFLLGIINDILDLSKIEAGKLAIAKEHFSVFTLLEDVYGILSVRASERGIDLVLDYQTPIPQTIQSDPKRLKQILVNLIGNGIKFTPRGSVTVIVDYESPPRGQANDRDSMGVLRFRIRDTGIGMSNEQQRRLFKPFSQGDERVNRQYGGTGLGLAISRRLANILGGDIEVESIEGEFSQFTFSISTPEVIPPTANDAHSFDGPSTVQSVRNDVQLQGQLQTAGEMQIEGRFLVVDDRRDIRFLSKRFLSSAGATVHEAEDGRAAVDWVRQAMSEQREPRLIFLDMQMPRMDGYQAAKELRRMGFTGPIIALTADAMQGDMNKCLEAGCNDYLPKPIDKIAMLRKVADLLAVS